MEEDLKPCPFCGRGVAMQHRNGSWGYTSDTVSVSCSKCAIKFTEETEKYSHAESRTVSIRAEAEAKLRMRWNTRHGSDDERIKELEMRNARLALPHIQIGIDGGAYLRREAPKEHRAYFSFTEDAMASMPLNVLEREVRHLTEKIIRQMLAKAAEIQNKTKAGEEQ